MMCYGLPRPLFCSAVAVAVFIVCELSANIVGQAATPPFRYHNDTDKNSTIKLHFEFHLHNIEHSFSLGDYSFHGSLSEFWLLCVLRVTLLLFAMAFAAVKGLKGRRWISKYMLVIVCLALAAFSFTLVKLLAWSEVVSNLSLVGFWILFGWNCLGSAIWIAIIRSLSAHGDEDDETTVSDAEDRQQLISEPITDADDGEEKEKKEKISLKGAGIITVRLIRFCLPQWRWYLCGYATLLTFSLARVFVPLYTGTVINTIVQPGSTYDDLFHAILMMLLLSAVSSISAGLRGACFKYANAKVSRSIRDSVFRSLVVQEVGFYDQTKTGEIISRLTADTQTMSDTIGLNLNVFLRNFVMFIGGLIFMVILSWRLTMITFIAIPLIGVITKMYGAYYEKLSQQTQDMLAKANEVADEVIGSMRTVKSFATELFEADRYKSKLDEVLDVNRKQSIAILGYYWSNDLFDLSILTGVLWYGGHLVLTKQMESGELIKFLLYQLQLGEALVGMGYVFTGLMQAVGASRKVFEYIDRPPELPNDGVDAPAKDGFLGKIEFKDVCFSYPSRKNVQVLNSTSFSVSAGETVALVGPSGGGKSSCIALLEHFYEPSSGQVLIDGKPVQFYDHNYIHRMVALVSQEPVLFGRSVASNISYGLEEVAREEIEKAAVMANASNFVTEIPTGYDTEVGEKGVQLSGGQKQRIAIARALIRQPKILLLDEATSALDAESEHLVQEAIYRNAKGHTVLLIAHRLSTVERADRIVVIDKGCVVQQGTHTELLSQDGIYKNLVHRQLLGGGAVSLSGVYEGAVKAVTTQQRSLTNSLSKSIDVAADPLVSTSQANSLHIAPLSSSVPKNSV